jgi:hypothetical protein
MRRPKLISLLAALAALTLSACGGGGDDKEVRSLLDRAFRQPIESAVVTADLEIEVKGIEQLKDPIRIKLTGPYVSGGGKRIPGFDWNVSFAGGGQTISAALTSTGQNVWVTFQGTPYQVGEESVRAFNRRLAQLQRQDRNRSLSQFGIHPRDWLVEGKDEGDEEVAGVETTHVRAKVDVAKMLDDLNRLAERTGSTVPGAPQPPKLTDSQQRDIEQAVDDPTLDVYVGKRDSTIHRLAANLSLDVPKEAQQQVGGITGGRISFSIEFSQIGRPQRIEGPRSARPIQELAQQLGGLGSLGAGTTPDGGATTSDADAQRFQRYSQCLEKADPSKVAEIQACSRLLR